MYLLLTSKKLRKLRLSMEDSRAQATPEELLTYTVAKPVKNMQHLIIK